MTTRVVPATVTPPGTVTDSEIRSGTGTSNFDDPTRKARRARARGILNRSYVAWQRAARRWWLLTTRPMSFRAAWRMSQAADPTRVPAGSRLLLELWRWDNRIGTGLAFYLLAMAAPTCLTGPILWCRVKVGRRLGVLAACAVLAVGWSIARGTR